MKYIFKNANDNVGHLTPTTRAYTNECNLVIHISNSSASHQSICERYPTNSINLAANDHSVWYNLAMDHALTSPTYLCYTLVPALYHLPISYSEFEWLSSIAWRIEFCSVLKGACLKNRHFKNMSTEIILLMLVLGMFWCHFQLFGLRYTFFLCYSMQLIQVQ